MSRRRAHVDDRTIGDACRNGNESRSRKNGARTFDGRARRSPRSSTPAGARDARSRRCSPSRPPSRNDRPPHERCRPCSRPLKDRPPRGRPGRPRPPRRRALSSRGSDLRPTSTTCAPAAPSRRAVSGTNTAARRQSPRSRPPRGLSPGTHHRLRSSTGPQNLQSHSMYGQAKSRPAQSRGPVPRCQTTGSDRSSASEDGLALLGEGVEPFEIVAAVVRLPPQALDAFVHLGGDGLVVVEDTELFLDHRDGQR